MNFNVGKILIGLINPQLFLKKTQLPEQNRVGEFNNQLNLNQANTLKTLQQEQAQIGSLNNQINTKPNIIQEQNRIGELNNNTNSNIANHSKSDNSIKQNIEKLVKQTETQQTNNFTKTDRSVYIKNLLGLPQDIGQILQNAQNLNKPIIGGTLGLANMNPNLLPNPKVLSELFSETNPISQNVQEVLNILNAQTQQAAQTQSKTDPVALMFSGMVSLPEISKLIISNSKQAVAALIISMAAATKTGGNGKHIQDTLSVINSCISMAESDNPAQNLKSLMMLYLPWLPLNEGIGFDLEITTPDGENDSNDSKLTVLIQTKNYGNLKGVFTLTTSNSVDIYITCSDKFPKALLEKSLSQESTSHAMNTNIDIEDIKPAKDEVNETRETKVNLSATNEMNPYLLLMAHSFIRHTILIDNSEELN